MAIKEMKSLVATAPELPGVYRFYDESGKSLYVGKALSLKKRLYSYTLPQKQSRRLVRMLAQAVAFETIITATEHEALLLENNLIKSLKPKYNILFRDDKSYPHLSLSHHAYPRLSYRRGGFKKNHDCFGPFPDSSAVKSTIDVLQRVFRLRTCTDSVMATRQRPCIVHSIGRCSAPCVNKISPQQYQQDSEGARRFLRGERSFIEAQLTDSMMAAANQAKFEEAAIFRDRLRALNVIRQQQVVDKELLNVDYVGICRDGDNFCANIAMVRGGYPVGEHCVFPTQVDGCGEDDIARALLAQHYDSTRLPEKIIISSLPPDWQAVAPHLVGIIVAKPNVQQKKYLHQVVGHGQQTMLTQLASANLRQQRVKKLGDALQLPSLPQHIDCFDISHSMGEATTAARVVFVEGAPDKKSYRLYKIKTAKNDDGQSIYEAVYRCYSRVTKEKSPLPDIIFIDGGTIQLTAALKAFANLPTSPPPLVAVAKGAARQPGQETLINADGEVIKLPPTSPALHLIQSIRDEAHRFAITAHRRRRDKKRSRYQTLDGIEGVGDKKRQKVLAHFGGMAALRTAGIREISRVPSIGTQLAKRIYSALHG